ncbi:MAG: putative alpha-E superfamily protein [Zhongshania sp.]|jgi:uncharacterized alpha-E superfamily protein
MMLSRVAERVYWSGRYLERVESMARLIRVYTSLLFDLPRDTGISWYNLVVANGTHAEYDRRFTVQDEKRVVKFLLDDLSNPSSLVSSLRMVRENIRTTRDILPPESWELVNEFQIYVSENMDQGLSRRYRHEFLEQIIKTCQQINGLIADTMRRDAAWHFLNMGRSLERSDMTIRILEAGSSMSSDFIESDANHVLDVVWGSVLGTLNATMPYRRTMKVAVNADDAARFLLEDELFPRSVACGLLRMQDSAGLLPVSDDVTASLKKMLKRVRKGSDYLDVSGKFPKYLTELEKGSLAIHQAIQQTWFQPA